MENAEINTKIKKINAVKKAEVKDYKSLITEETVNI